MPSEFDSFYTDLSDSSHRTASVMFHIRFSTNTSPKWHLAQPYRVIAHNGEINTISGNRNWALARMNNLSSKRFGDMRRYQPLINQSGSDSSSLDNMLEVLKEGGVNIGRAARMIIPPSWQNTDLMDADEKAFHEYNSMHMEAWDGPALICFQDKNFLSCFLDRNGLRPAKIEFFNENFLDILFYMQETFEGTYYFEEISFGTGSTINQVKERLFDIYEDRFNFQESLDNEELLTEIQHQLSTQLWPEGREAAEAWAIKVNENTDDKNFAIFAKSMEKFHLKEIRGTHILDSIKEFPKEEKSRIVKKARGTCKWFI